MVLVTNKAIRRAKLQSRRHHQQTNTVFYRPDALPVTQPKVSNKNQKINCSGYSSCSLSETVETVLQYVNETVLQYVSIVSSFVARRLW